MPVGNIPYDATEEQLVHICEEVGPVVNFRYVFWLFEFVHLSIICCCLHTRTVSCILIQFLQRLSSEQFKNNMLFVSCCGTTICTSGDYMRLIYTGEVAAHLEYIYAEIEVV